MAFAGQIIALTLWWRSLLHKTCDLHVFREGMAHYVISVSHQSETDRQRFITGDRRVRLLVRHVGSLVRIGDHFGFSTRFHR
jgi:hypothetical protein